MCRKMQSVAILFISSVLVSHGFAQPREDKIEKRVQNVLAKMTLEEKVGQMTQITLQAVSKTRGTPTKAHALDRAKLEKAIIEYHVGSILNVFDVAHTVEYWHDVITAIQDIATQKTRLKIPVLYGIDAIHGAGYTREATLFPQNINMAATWNPELVRRSAEITAYEVRASGIPWNFNPTLGVGRNPLWPRLWETYGEDPTVVKTLGVEYVMGLQGEHSELAAGDRVAACLKHYLGYSVPLSGKDRTPAWIPDRMLREIFLPPFKAAIEAGARTVMVNSSEINGIPVHASHELLSDLLKTELGFRGFVLSDWADIINLYERDRVAANNKEAVKMAVLAGIDMSMVPYDFSFYTDLLALVREGSVPETRIDDAVSRILRVKFALGLFDNPYPDKKMKAQVGSAASAAVALQAAHESLTLLKNSDNLLPLAKSAKVLVTGPAADALVPLTGGWSYTWQGDKPSLYPKNKKTILQAVRDKAGAANVIYAPGCSFDAEIDLGAAVAAAQQTDVALVCIGEDAYTETPGNIDDLTLSEPQLRLASAIAQTGTPTVLILTEGRPRLINRIADGARAILMAYLPGPEGGQAIADVLFGDFNPCGKLPITYPRHPNALLCYDHKYSEIKKPNRYDPQFPFGLGLSYTRFAYSDLALNRDRLALGDTLTVSVTVTNTGPRRGKEVAILYLSDLVRSVTPPVRQVKKFAGVWLDPGESKTLAFALTQQDLAFVGRQNTWIVEPGAFRVAIGGLVQNFVLE